MCIIEQTENQQQRLYADRCYLHLYVCEWLMFELCDDDHLHLKHFYHEPTLHRSFLGLKSFKFIEWKIESNEHCDKSLHFL